MIGQATSHGAGEILIVDDNHDDFVLMKMAFKRSRVPLNLRHVTDGLDCLTFLHKEEAWANVPTPDLILLDLNMPRMSGPDVLKAMMEDEELRHLPVIVFSTSTNPDEIGEMYRLGCRSFIVKPVDFERLIQIVDTLIDYWFTVVALPGEVSRRKKPVATGMNDRPASQNIDVGCLSASRNTSL
jgi:chemotaxis family two-component system response regulator Rcp1